MRTTLRIATRNSPLALWQAKYIKQQLLTAYPNLTIELLPLTTTGDRFLGTPLATLGGKGLFVKELEQALLEGKADFAVHSIKDLPVNFPTGLQLVTICERADPRDVLILAEQQQQFDIMSLPVATIIGTTSLRRRCQLLAIRPDLNLQNLRGNVNTRLRRLEDGEFTGIILAAAGLERLGLAHRISSYLPTDICLPAVGQGALGIECREDDSELIELLKILEHQLTRSCVLAERAFNEGLGGGCHVPIAAYAELQNDKLHLRGLVGKLDGSLLLYDELVGDIEQPEAIGKQLAEKLLARGAGDILKAVYR